MIDSVVTVAWIVGKILLLLIPLLVTVAWYTFAERKVIGFIQVRMGPNRVGPAGWFQPIADAIKLMFKELIIPSGAQQVPVRARPGAVTRHRVGGLGGDSIQR